MKYVLPLLLLSGCAHTISGTCQYKDDPPYTFTDARYKEIKLGNRDKEIWIEVEEERYFAFDPGSCVLEPKQ
jgi:hypothetical protein